MFYQNIRQIENFGLEFRNQTVVHPVALFALVICVILTLSLPRRLALIPLIAYMCFVSPAQRIVVLEFDLHFTRLITAAGLLRATLRGEWYAMRWHLLDTLLLCHSAIKIIINLIQLQTTAAFIFQVGTAYDLLSYYFLVRAFIRSPDDIRVAARAIACVAVPAAMFFVFEKLTRYNIFSAFGGVPEITVMREGKLRCQGPFPHPIVAGCYWASFIPMVLLSHNFLKARYSFICVIGTVCCLVIVALCNSSTPLGGVIAGVVGASFFPLRGKMRWVVAATIVLLIALHFAMEAPVWHLISRVSLSHGSTAYFRFQLIDHAIRRFGEWALVGTPQTAHWFWGAQDITNQYILEGVRGGILTLVAFWGVLVLSFTFVGRSVRNSVSSPADALLYWSIGVALFVHCVNFLGVSYFGQSIFAFGLTLGLIGSLSNQCVEEEFISDTDDPTHTGGIIHN